MLERPLERLLFASRWIMAPFYLGLALSLVALLVKFTQELAHFVLGVFEARDTDVILGILTLIDLSLAGNLLLIVIFSGYENFVSKIDHAEEAHRPDWMGKVDFSGLKLKLLASIVAISAIHLLKAFMDVSKYSDRDLMWLTIVHGVFVASGVLLAWADKLSSSKKNS
jgi:uncharacterized protein (TIGR00645 family)